MIHYLPTVGKPMACMHLLPIQYYYYSEFCIIDSESPNDDVFSRKISLNEEDVSEENAIILYYLAALSRESEQVKMESHI